MTDSTQILDPVVAQKIAEEWITAWNAHDLDAIMAHYSDEIEFWSPIIVKRLGLATGKITDKALLRDYFARGLAASPQLHFTLIQVFVGIDSLTVHYRRWDGTEGAELMVLDETGHRVRIVRAHYNGGV